MSALSLESRTTIARDRPPCTDLHPVAPAATRLTLIATPVMSMRDWRVATPGIVFVDARSNPSEILAGSACDDGLDVTRVILDGGITAQQFLDTLAAAPAGSLAEILWICDDGSGYLSAAGRGGDRILYVLRAEDVRFFLEINGLVTNLRLLRSIFGEPKAPVSRLGS